MVTRPGLRADIQALRAIAVGLVLLDHFRIGPFHNGFLGVDIFFVVSGFLITGIVARDMADGRFSFIEFYERRARRILPAAYVTIALTTVGALLFMDGLEIDSLTAQVLGAVTYTINLVLWDQVGYFDLAAGSKPLLHMWSLAIEEQFYLLFPAVLFLVPTRLHLPVLVGLGLASLALCLAVVVSAPSAAFYLLPTRAWELLLGSVSALIVRRRPHPVPGWICWPALALIAAVSVRGTGLPHPSLDAGLVASATLLVILARNARLEAAVATRLLARIGDISYSLYLVHWPVVVFLNSVYLGATPSVIRIAGLAASVVLAVLLHVLVEEPMRRAALRGRRLAAAVVGLGALLVAAQAGAQAFRKPDLDFAHIRRPNYGLDKVCDNYRFENRVECRTTPDPQTLVWGDSYAMFAAAGARYHLPGGMVQATYSACPPFIGYAPYLPARDDARLLSEYCIAFNDQVLAFLRGSRVSTVVLAASYLGYAMPGGEMLRRGPDGEALREATAAAAGAEKMGEVVRALRAMGKAVVVLSPPPAIGDDNVLCSERELMASGGKPGETACTLPAAAVRSYNAPTAGLMQAAAAAGATVVDLSPAVCDAVVCRAVVEGVPLYRDSGHLSYVGAEKVFAILAGRRLLPPPFD